MFNEIKIFLKRIFSINIFDNHLVIYLFFIRIRLRLKTPYVDLTLNEYGLNKSQRDTKITVSLTSYPKRINNVSKTITTVLKQTLKPDNVVLWLSYEQFKDKEDNLPDDLINLKQYGLTIKWCKDIKSYKKLIPALVEYRGDIIITVDDDIYYPFDLVENLYFSYLKDKNSIHANRIKRLKLIKGKIKAENSAKLYAIKYDKPSYLNKITGCGGVLYPPDCFSDLVFKDDIFMKLIPTQDDVWFWAMAVLNGYKIEQVQGFDISLIPVDGSQKTGLSKINRKSSSGINSLDAVIKILEYFPEIKEKLKEE